MEDQRKVTNQGPFRGTCEEVCGNLLPLCLTVGLKIVMAGQSWEEKNVPQAPKTVTSKEKVLNICLSNESTEVLEGEKK